MNGYVGYYIQLYGFETVVLQKENIGDEIILSVVKLPLYSWFSDIGRLIDESGLCHDV